MATRGASFHSPVAWGIGRIVCEPRSETGVGAWVPPCQLMTRLGYRLGLGGRIEPTGGVVVEVQDRGGLVRGKEGEMANPLGCCLLLVYSQ